MLIGLRSAMDFDEAFALESKGEGIIAWEYNPDGEDQRMPHEYTPNRPVSMEHLKSLGVLWWQIDTRDYENNPKLEKIKRERGYTYSEIKTISRSEIADFDGCIRGFFSEHTHSQEEIRLILDGSGYWDIRDEEDKWVRFFVKKGDMVVLPPGMFHRFTVDQHEYIQALLLFTQKPVRTQEARSEELSVRKQYIEDVLRRMPKSKYYRAPKMEESKCTCNTRNGVHQHLLQAL